MSSSRISTFDKTVEKTNAWIDELRITLGLDDHHKAYMLLRGVLHALRDRLSPDELADLSAQLPMLVRGFLYEGWKPAHKPLRYRHKAEFLERVTREAPWLEASDSEQAVTAVFVLLSAELREDNGELAQVRESLPAELRELWPKSGL